MIHTQGMKSLQLISANVERLLGETVEFLREMIRVPSFVPPGKEYPEIANIVAQKMKQIGCQTELVEAPSSYVSLSGGDTIGLCGPRVNVLGRFDGNTDGPSLIFNGHMDVVPVGTGWTVDPWGGEVKEGKIFGRGASDNKGGIAAMVMALKALLDSGVNLKGRLILAATVDEEVGGHAGLKYLVDTGLVKGDYGINTDSTYDQVTVSVNGRLRWKVFTYGRSAHSSIAHLGENAIEHMARVVLAVQEYSKRLEKRSAKIPVSPDTKKPYVYPIANVGVIQGGVKDSTVPDQCQIELDRRIIPGENIEDARSELRSVIEKALNEQGARSKIIETSARIPASIPLDHPLVIKVRGLAERVRGKHVGIYGDTGSNDMQYLINDAKIPTCGFGSWTSDAHGNDEFIRVEDLCALTKIYALIATEILNQPTS